MLTIALDTFQAVIFDMDGTMVDNGPAHKRAWHTFLERQGYTLTDEEFQRFSGNSAAQIMPRFFTRTLSPIEISGYIEERDELYREAFGHELQLMPGLQETLATLAAFGLKLAIATGASMQNRAFILEGLDLHRHFATILGEEHISRPKPDPEIFLKAAEKLGVAPENCLVFEDSPPGVQAGKRAGMTVIGVLSTHTPDELAEADYVMQNYQELAFVRS